MFFLNATDPQTIKVARKLMIEWGYKAQRLGNRLLQACGEGADEPSARHHRRPAEGHASR